MDPGRRHKPSCDSALEFPGHPIYHFLFIKGNTKFSQILKRRDFKTNFKTQTGSVSWDAEGDGSEVLKGEDICIPMADLCSGLTENNKIL